MISALEAKRLLHKGCEAYLTHVVDKYSSKVTLDSVPVVREVLDVFLEDLPGLLMILKLNILNNPCTKNNMLLGIIEARVETSGIGF